MLGTWKALAVVAALTNSIMAQEVATCNRGEAPNWDDCEQVIVQLGWRDAGTETYNVCNQKDQCMTWYIGTCSVGLCWTTNDCVSLTHRELATDYRIIEGWCKPDDLGGYREPPNARLEVRYRAAAAIASAGLVEEHYTLEDYKEIFQINDTISKRQDPTWQNLVTQKGVTKPGLRYQASQELSSGTEETWSSSTSVSISISVTAGVSASLFQIFTASMEISTTYETTRTITQQLTFKAGNCPKQAIVFWEPVFDKYIGVFSDAPNDEVEIWVAREFNGQAEGRFVTDCIGTSKRAWRA